jgi:hypothetical protein
VNDSNYEEVIEDDSELPRVWSVEEYEKAYVEEDCINKDIPAFVKYDSSKRDYSLVPWGALDEVVKVLEAGAEKYTPDNWRRGTVWTRYWSASMRHITAWIRGESVDQETGLSHLAHAVCCLLFLISYEMEGLGTDDRVWEMMTKETKHTTQQ